ncbi:MAG: restriction endonuclease subunit S, partial [Ignavibacteriaceae bacterium]
MNISCLPTGWINTYRENLIKDKKNAIKRGPFGSTVKKSFFVERGYKVYEQKNAIYDDSDLGNYFIDQKKYDEFKDFNVQPGDFIVCSGTIGRIHKLNSNALPGIINQALLKLSIDESIIVHNYFLFLFRSNEFQSKILKETRGSAMQNITSVKDLKKLEILLPPLNEQFRIVDKIEELFTNLDAVIAELKNILQQVKRYRQSVLKAAFEGKLTGINNGELKPTCVGDLS